MCRHLDYVDFFDMMSILLGVNVFLTYAEISSFRTVVASPGCGDVVHRGFKGDPYIKSRIAVHYMLGINHNELL